MIMPATEIRRYFRQTKVSSSSGTFWRVWGGWITAQHVIEAQSNITPPFIKGAAFKSNKVVDAVIFDCKLPTERPRDPIEGERILIYGYPKGSCALTYRVGEIYLKRKTNASAGYLLPTWIIKIDEPKVTPYASDVDIGATYEPVVVGMSGGLIQSESGDLLGVLTVRNSPMDSNFNRILEQSCDFQALSDIWDVFSSQQGSLKV